MRIHFTLLFFCLTVILKGQTDLIPTSHYVCAFTEESLSIDGKANETAWQNAPWTASFVNINDIGLSPYLDTKVKMLWDDNYFYFYAQMEEPHVWAKLTKRDAVIFYDNDIELFIDPDGDTHNYYELEINALNTIWDLLLTRPYRDQGQAINAWDIKGLKSAVSIEGSLNNPTDKDQYWAVEVAIPWEVLKEANSAGKKPRTGDIWRINYSRVQWETEVIDGAYVKKTNPETGKVLPENNWVWSRQRAIAMHEPEFWGKVLFTDNTGIIPKTFYDAMEEEIRQLLYTIHRNQKEHKKNKGVFSQTKKDILPHTSFLNGLAISWELSADKGRYLAKVIQPDTLISWYIDHTGRSWKEIKNE